MQVCAPLCRASSLLEPRNNNENNQDHTSHGTVVSEHQHRHHCIHFSHQAWGASQLSIIISASRVGAQGTPQNHTAHVFGQIWSRPTGAPADDQKIHTHFQGHPLSQTCKSPVFPSRPLDTLRHTEPQQAPRPLARAPSGKRGNGTTRGKTGTGVQVRAWGASGR